tara:strand:- start:444 stop:554 length:111 start_codon:yes stop_codon:yes gene_type:complete
LLLVVVLDLTTLGLEVVVGVLEVIERQQDSLLLLWG